MTCDRVTQVGSFGLVPWIRGVEGGEEGLGVGLDVGGRWWCGR